MTSAWGWIASIWSPIRTCTRDASSPWFGGSYPPCEFQAHIICFEKWWMLLEINYRKILRSLYVCFPFQTSWSPLLTLGHHYMSKSHLASSLAWYVMNKSWWPNWWFAWPQVIKNHETTKTWMFLTCCCHHRQSFPNLLLSAALSSGTWLKFGKKILSSWLLAVA